jgi:DNA-binding NarL/FixJ family response regulator
LPAANDSLISSLVVTELHRGAMKSGPAPGDSGKQPSPLIDRRRSERRHIARRRDDGQQRHWRSDDRRSGERRCHASPDLAIAAVEDPWNRGLPARSADAEAISVFVVSQRRDLVAALGSGLANQPGMQLIGVCHAEIADLHAVLVEASPDLILFDSALLIRFGAGRLAEIREAACDAKLILIWDEAHPLAVEEIEKQRICGCIPLLASARHYARAIREVSQGGLWLPRWIMSRVCRRILVKEESPAAAVVAPSTTLPALTAREQAIARRAAAGKTNKEIAIELNVSPDTVKKHLGAVFDKVGVHRRSQLAYCLALPGQKRPE